LIMSTADKEVGMQEAVALTAVEQYVQYITQVISHTITRARIHTSTDTSLEAVNTDLYTKRKAHREEGPGHTLHRRKLCKQ